MKTWNKWGLVRPYKQTLTTWISQWWQCNGRTKISTGAGYFLSPHPCVLSSSQWEAEAPRSVMSCLGTSPRAGSPLRSLPIDLEAVLAWSVPAEKWNPLPSSCAVWFLDPKLPKTVLHGECPPSLACYLAQLVCVIIPQLTVWLIWQPTRDGEIQVTLIFF